jgi:hypothetical protein
LPGLASLAQPAARRRAPLAWPSLERQPAAPACRALAGILFFELTLDAALWTGVVAGLAYCCMVKLMYRQHFAAMHRLQQQQAQALAGSPAAPPVVVAV